MKRRIVSVSLTVALLSSALLSMQSVVHAQQVPSYQPSRPTLSPYLYLTRPNAGPFPNYQTFVQPAQNQQQFNQIQRTQISQLQQNQQQLQQQQLQLQQLGPSGMAPTGVGSSYNSLSHFYPTASTSAAGGGGRGRSAPRR